MPLTWDDIKIDLGEEEITQLLSHWNWLVPSNMNPILVSSLGDMWLSNQEGQIFWLNVGVGCLEKVANTETEFMVKLNDDEIANEWFMFELLLEIKNNGLKLNQGELFGYVLLPIIGGKYIANNFETTCIHRHFSYAGQIHQQLRDLPDGTEVNLNFQ